MAAGCSVTGSATGSTGCSTGASAGVSADRSTALKSGVDATGVAQSC
ncbi:hypothetical protein IJL65_00605 [bacterium]|nr:hypothetical protein [bacterium]